MLQKNLYFLWLFLTGKASNTLELPNGFSEVYYNVDLKAFVGTLNVKKSIIFENVPWQRPRTFLNISFSENLQTYVGEGKNERWILNSITGATKIQKFKKYDKIFYEDKLGQYVEIEGSKKYILNKNTLRRVSEGYHEIFYDGKLRQYVGEFGAYQYILDGKTWRRISDGYHKILYDKSLKRYIGQIGATNRILKGVTMPVLS